MFDGFQVVINISTVFDRLRDHISELVDHVACRTGEVISSTAKVNGLRVRLTQGFRKIVKINGSLHRFFSGDNSTLFSFRQLVITVKRIASEFGVDITQAILQRIEIGVNLPVEEPEEMIDSAILFRGYPPSQRVQKRRKYYKEWRFTEYTIKLYRKGEHQVRFEIRMFRQRKLDEVKLHTLADVVDYEKFCSCLKYLEALTDGFLFVPKPSEEDIPAPIRSEWANYRNDQFWKHLKKWTKSRIKDHIINIIKENGLFDWKDYLVAGLQEQGALMISSDGATISPLGLQKETVADPKGDCNRRKDESPYHDDSFKHNSNSILIHRLDAYAWWIEDVIIYTLRYQPLLSRGPPSLLPVFLSAMYL